MMFNGVYLSWDLFGYLEMLHLVGQFIKRNIDVCNGPICNVPPTPNNSINPTYRSSAIFRPSSSEEESEDEMMALDLIFPLREGGRRSCWDWMGRNNKPKHTHIYTMRCLIVPWMIFLIFLGPVGGGI